MRFSFKRQAFKYFRRETKRSDGYSAWLSSKKKEVSKDAPKPAVGIYTFSSGKEVSEREGERAKIKDLPSNGVFKCKKCSSDLWAVVQRRFLFWVVDVVYCQKCGIPLEAPNYPGYLSYKDFKEHTTDLEPNVSKG